MIPTEPGNQRIAFAVPIFGKMEGERKAQSFETVGEFPKVTLEQSDIVDDEDSMRTWKSE
jgi:hypothetical protein